MMAMLLAGDHGFIDEIGNGDQKMPRATPKRKPSPWSIPPSAERCTSDAKSGVISDATISATAKTDGEGPDHAQLAAVGDEFAGDGNFLDQRFDLRRKDEGHDPATIQPAIARASRTKPRE